MTVRRVRKNIVAIRLGGRKVAASLMVVGALSVLTACESSQQRQASTYEYRGDVTTAAAQPTYRSEQKVQTQTWRSGQMTSTQGQKFQTQQQQFGQMQQGQSHSFSGRVVELRQVQVESMKPYLVATVESNVLLGDQQQVQQLGINRGQQISVQGHSSQLQGQQALVADQLSLNGRQVSIQAREIPQDQQTFGVERQPGANIQATGRQESLQGTIVDVRQINVPATDQHVAATIHTDVLLGAADELQGLRINEGQNIQVQGTSGQINGQQALIADSINYQGRALRIGQADFEGATYGVERQTTIQQYGSEPADQRFGVERQQMRSEFDQTRTQQRQLRTQPAQGDLGRERWEYEQRLPGVQDDTSEGLTEQSQGVDLDSDVQLRSDLDRDADIDVQGEGDIEIDSDIQEQSATPADDVQQIGAAIAPGTVNVSLAANEIRMPQQLQAGQTNFRVTNLSEEPLTFHIEGQGISRSLDGAIQPGQSRNLQLNLQPGTYKVHAVKQTMQITVVQPQQQ